MSTTKATDDSIARAVERYMPTMTGVQLTDEQRRDAETGIEWWNHLPEYSRAAWLKRADTAKPAVAWSAYKFIRDYALLYRAFVEPRDYRGVELTIFVEAYKRSEALDKITRAVALIEGREVDLRDRIYNMVDVNELLEEHISEDVPLRIFETGWANGRPYYGAEHPLFLVKDPAPLCRLWARCVHERETT